MDWTKAMEMELLSDLVQRGEEKIAAAAAKEKAHFETRQCLMREAWLELEEAVSAIFPEQVRRWVVLDLAHAEVIDDMPNNPAVLFPVIKAPGCAPIGCRVEQIAGSWEMVVDRRGGGGLYHVPEAYEDFEFGVQWTWVRGAADYVDDIEVALAMARAAMKRRQELEAKSALRQAKADAPVRYEPVEDEGNVLVEELVRMIRDVVREELEARGL